MAQTVKESTLIERFNVGGRTLTISELVLGTEYKTEGIVVSPTEHLFLTDGLADFVFLTSAGLAAKNVKSLFGEFVVTNPGGIKAEAASVKLQLYEQAVAKEPPVEIADKSGLYKEAKVIVIAVGR